ncbi:MAG: hypothetical protein KDD29_11235, partial [Flavobacteriales bacterium]|nr:hypothetical protein [Flavobacteriales bacterium]
AKLKGAKVTTSMKPEYSCAIANIGFENWKANEIEATLYAKHKIHSSSMIIKKVNGIRVTPNVYTNLFDLDLLVKGLTTISTSPAPIGE